MRTIIVWYRNDLRIHDHPALWQALQDAERVVPVFILDKALLDSERASSNRNRFLLESLEDLRNSLRAIGGELCMREGKPQTVLAQLAAEADADAVYYSQDYTGYAVRRDAAVRDSLAEHDVTMRGFAGRMLLDEAIDVRAKNGNIFKVFTPFWKQWSQLDGRPVREAPTAMTLPPDLAPGNIPAIGTYTNKATLSPDVLPGGETAGRKRLKAFMAGDIHHYVQSHNDLGRDGTSRLSPYIHFGCLSALEIATQLPEGQGADAFHRQLAWRDFYNYVLHHFPDNATQEFQERYRTFDWQYDERLLAAWQEGRTGYPVVDAAMRQLRQEGWMHNRGRLIVGSFLTKDLGLDWRLGERFFMQWLMDGDQANNNGNWQWIASVGVDPAPVFRRLYNPASQQAQYDPEGAYVRRYVPELARVPDKYLAEPWKMPDDEQQRAGCVIGREYPAPVVNHAEARKTALERYRSAPR
jgi:deoxyribodipyrimidine photo-lyase